MPLYEFLCQDCETRFETLISLGKEDSVCCISCQGRKVKKLVSSFGIGGGSSRIKDSTSCDSCSSTQCSTCKSA